MSDTAEALGKKARVTTWFRPDEANVMPPPMAPEEVCTRFHDISMSDDSDAPLQMHELGFDGYAIDFVECPQAMRGFLTRECQLHRTVGPSPRYANFINFSNSLLHFELNVSIPPGRWGSSLARAEEIT